MKIYELQARNQKSYYGKAKVIETNKKIKLQSYETIVSEFYKDSKTLKIYGWYSQTTMKHIKDFSRMFTNKDLNKKEVYNGLSIQC